MARGRSGVISKEYKGEDNTAYHDVIKLFKIYRVVNWQMQIKISQVKRRFHMEYGTDVDEFLDTIYQAGMDVERDLASEKERVEAISRSNQYLRLIDEAVDLMRRYHPQGERYYWVLYYSYLSSTKLENVEEILDKYNHNKANAKLISTLPNRFIFHFAQKYDKLYHLRNAHFIYQHKISLILLIFQALQSKLR